MDGITKLESPTIDISESPLQNSQSCEDDDLEAKFDEVKMLNLLPRTRLLETLIDSKQCTAPFFLNDLAENISITSASLYVRIIFCALLSL